MKNFLYRASIIIVNYNTGKHLKQCLKSFNGLLGNKDFEIIIVDNNSRDDSLKTAREEFPDVKIIQLEDNQGFGRANNIGIANSSGKYLILMNSDTEVSSAVIFNMLEHMQKDSSIGVLGCRQEGADGNPQLSLGKFPTFFSEFARKSLQEKMENGDISAVRYFQDKYSDIADVDWVSGSFMVISREALDKAGSFDPAFFMYYEDIDLCTRINQSGYRVCYIPQLAILHHKGVSTRDNLLRYRDEHRRSQYYFCKKYYGNLGVFALKLYHGIKKT